MGALTETDIARAVAAGNNPHEIRICDLTARHPDRHRHGAEDPDTAKP